MVPEEDPASSPPLSEAPESIRIRAAVMVVQDGCVLLVRHQKNGRTYWLLPGGGMEFGEDAPQTARREVEEETGLQVEVGVLALVSETLAPDGSRHVVNLVFRARAVGGLLRVGQEERLAEARFVPWGELPTLEMHPPLGNLLRESLEWPGARYLGRLWVD